MPSLSWHWVLVVWAYALAWFLLTDRVKLLAYRVLDPFSSDTVAPTGTTTTEPGSHTRTQKRVAHTSTVAPPDADSEVPYPRSELSIARETPNGPGRD